jgi:hypothetical protein
MNESELRVGVGRESFGADETDQLGIAAMSTPTSTAVLKALLPKKTRAPLARRAPLGRTSGPG